MNTPRFPRFLPAFLLLALASPTFAAESPVPSPVTSVSADDAKIKADAQLHKKAAEWTASLSLNDAAKEARLTALIATHLIAVRDWHNDHPHATVPAGINPLTGKQSKFIFMPTSTTLRGARQQRGLDKYR